jgi:hypothetical protein
MPPLIQTLSPAMVPRRAFAFSRWYRGQGPWYYHRVQRMEVSVARELPPNVQAELDPPLRPLCQLLHDYGLATTPSCAGHFHGDDYFRQVWEALRCEAEAIRAEGLVVRDAENGRGYRFLDPGYRLPWSDGASFRTQAQAQQRAGYVGALVSGDHGQLAAALQTAVEHRRQEVHVAQRLVGGGRLIDLHVRAARPRNQERAWALLTQAAGDYLTRFG